MLDRADSWGNPGLAVPAPQPFPAWARPAKPPENPTEAAFFAAAALTRLDLIVRDAPPWAGALRQRLALRAAAASVAHSGRSEGEGALRDAFHLTRSGADPGPAGRRLAAWRALTGKSTGHWRPAIVAAAEALAIPQDDVLEAAIAAAAACAGGPEPAPFAAAKAFALAQRVFNREAGPRLSGRGGEGELLAAWLADSVLAHKLNWPFAVPLLGVAPFTGSARRTTSHGDETAHILSGYAQGAVQACDLAADLGRRAQKLHDAAPKLRAKGAGAALASLLEDDCLSAASRIPGLSERGARRLFERLVGLGAIRELTGRATFRLYGL
jgi:hypothetical protein